MGEEWNDQLLDDIAQASGGTSDFIPEGRPEAVLSAFERQVRTAQATIVRNAEMILRLVQVADASAGRGGGGQHRRSNAETTGRCHPFAGTGRRQISPDSSGGGRTSGTGQGPIGPGDKEAALRDAQADTEAGRPIDWRARRRQIMPLCQNCGSQQPDGAAFCDECGAKLGEVTPSAAPPVAAMPSPAPTVVAGIRTCPVCGASVTPGEAFCDNCGAALGRAAPAQQSWATVPAPAEVSALTCSNCGAQLEPGSNFCDMCGAPASKGLPASPPSSPIPAPPRAPTLATPSPKSTTPMAGQYEQAPPSTPPPPPAHPPGPAIQGRLIVQGTNATLSFPAGRTEVVIGREDPVSNVFPEVDLTDHGGDEGGVSRRHARIFVQGIQVFVEDLNSTNYTYVNQQRLTPGQPLPLNDGDELRFGRVKLWYYT